MLSVLADSGEEKIRYVVPLRVVMAIFGVTKAMVSEYVKAGMPTPGRNKYDLVGCVRWWLARKQAEIDRQLAGLDWKDQEVRLKRAKADRQEMDNEVARGELVKAADMVEHYGRFVSAYRARTLAIGSNLAPRVLSCKTLAEAKEMIDKETWEALNELSRGMENHSDPASDDRPTAKTDRKRVGRSKPRVKSRVKRKSGVVAD